MNTRLALVTLLLIVTCSTATVPQGNLPQEKLNDEQIIRNQLAAYAVAHRNGDGKAQATFYTADGEVRVWCAPSITKGREAIAKAFEVPPERRSGKFQLEIKNVSFMRSDMAFVDTEYGSPSPPSGRAFYVMVKQGDTWLIRVNRTARFQPCS